MAAMTTGDRSAARRHAAAEWAALEDRLRTVTPQAVGRTALTGAVVVGLVWIFLGTWPALLPFIVGGILAYGLLPVVDALDRVLPRFLAALVSVLAVVAVLVAIAVLVLPPLALAFVRLAVDLPTTADIDEAVARLQQELGTLPEGSATVLVPTIAALATTVRDVFSGAAGGLDDVVRGSIRALLNAVGALLGLIVLPTWMLAVMTEKRRARAAVDSRITPWLRPDAWAVVAIADRAAGAYLRGYVAVAFLVGVLTYVGTVLSPRLGGPEFSEPLALAAFAGATQVVPVVGALLGLIPGLLVLSLDPERAAGYFVIYIAARLLGASIVGSRLMERRLGVHPAILIPGVVGIGQFGLLWLLLSAPIIATAVDLVRYFHGRLSEPPAPAGVLPRTSTPASAAAAGRSVPSAYRVPQAPAPLAGTTPTAAQPPA